MYGLIGLLSVACVIGTNYSENTPDLKLPKDPVLRKKHIRSQMHAFLKLHVTNCGYISLCSLPANMDEPDLNLYEDHQPCCASCSCEQGCETVGSCCPDYELFRITGNITFQNVTGLVQAMDEYGMFDRDQEPRGGQAFEHHTSCVSTGLIDNLYLPKGSDYTMVTSCPAEFSAENELVRKCEMLDEDLEGNIPVYSHTDNRTYRNIHCLECHGLNILTATYWGVTMTCATTDVNLHRHFKGPGDVEDGVKSGEIPLCNIVFVPGDNMETTKCTFVKVAYCPPRILGFVSVIDYAYICRMYFLPVENLNGLTATTYRNIACFSCINTGVSFKENCINWAARNEVQLYFLLNREAPTSSESTESKPLDIEIDKSGHCTKGRVFDNDTSECRLVLCPRLMYNQNGACIPLYSSFGPVYYSLTMKATYTKETDDLRTGPAIVDGAAFTAEAEKALIKAVQVTLTNDEGLYDFDFSIYAKLKDLPGKVTDAVEYYFVYVKYWYPQFQGEYSQTVKQAQKVVTSLAKLNIRTILGIISFELELYSKVILGKSNAGKVDELTQRYSYTNRQLGVLEVPMSINNFCYRIALRYGELRFLRSYYTIRRTGKKVYPLNFDTESKTNVPLTCLQNLLDDYRMEMFVASGKEDVLILTDDVDAQIDSVFTSQRTMIEISSFLCLFFMICVVVLLSVLKKRNARSS